MSKLISPSLGYLLSHYGPLLTLAHLAEVLHTTPGAIRMILRRERAPLAAALARAERSVGRRLTFNATLVAAIIEGHSDERSAMQADPPDGSG